MLKELALYMLSDAVQKNLPFFQFAALPDPVRACGLLARHLVLCGGLLLSVHVDMRPTSNHSGQEHDALQAWDCASLFGVQTMVPEVAPSCLS